MRYQEFKNLVNKPFFRKSDLVLLGIKAYNSQLSLWVTQNYIQRVKNGLYVFSDTASSIDNNTISFLLYEPSYVSVESALRHYGLIPEIVQSVTCVSTKNTRTFTNTYGRFIYRHIKSDLFWGYTVVEHTYGKSLLAEPEKALLDYIYFNQKRLKKMADIEELRINAQEFNTIIQKTKLKKYLQQFDSPSMNRIVDMLLQHVNT